MTIDDLASATQREFQEVRNEMATKFELNEFKNEILRAIDRVDTHLSAFASRANEDIVNLQESVQEHDGRLRALERRG
jgi:molecular chaperone GrpE (heat shock protein)